MARRLLCPPGKVGPALPRHGSRRLLLFRNGALRVRQWASDDAIEAFGLSRERALLIPEINAAAIGLNVKNPTAAAFLQQWFEAARREVAFRGSREPLRRRADYADMKANRGGRASADPRVRGHRHDQTVTGILAHQLRMKLTPRGIQPYSASRRMIRPGTVIAIDRTMGDNDAELRSIRQIRRDRYIGALAQWTTAAGTRRG